MIRFLKYSASNYKPLEENAKHNFAKQHTMQIYGSNAIYSFIPKNACSTMRTSIAYANGCIDNTEDFNWIHKNNQTFNAELSDLIVANYTFTILRCPFARLASVYLDKIVSRDRVAWKFYDLIDRKIELEHISFARFVQELNNNTVKSGDQHWRSQVDFMVYKQYDDYFCLENFAEVMTTLKAKIDLEIIDARNLTNHGLDKLKFVDNDYSQVKPAKIFNLKQEGCCPSPKSLYNDELIEAVSKLYQDDIKLYQDVIEQPQLMFKL
ncbi:sulfotransferase family 2 domain-containing protein [Pleurocapsa sp. FMAR1]|uniref:sulfotransferase family 2 domain-containing protein n=1 Tax=Pleurocapsa sp. FMAR1 TaxID=3040204 RepID=UPI0029C671F0|nr:sulfotransferase family 2 domain-containing protein [Pleurocapsa sp. FMAR1]